MSTVFRNLAVVATVFLYGGMALAQAPAPAKGQPPATAPAAKAPAPGDQPAPPPATAPAPSVTTAAPSQPPSPPANYEYRVDTRRDPFISLINRGTDARGRAGQPRVVRAADGVAALTSDEIAVRGILNNRGTWIAMVTGPGGKMFTVKAGDRLADGVIREVTPQVVIIMQEINDPLSLEKQREVRKPLRGGEVK